MNSSISSLAAKEHVADLRRIADGRRAAPNTSQLNASTPEDALTVALRLAGADESPIVRDLAALDGAPNLEGPVLLALTDGEAIAALSIRDARVVANPFVHTDAAVALLRLRAEHLSGKRPRRRWPRILRPRFA